MARRRQSDIALTGEPNEQLRSLLRERGLRCTIARLEVLAVLGESLSTAHHLTVPEIHARLMERGLRVDLATVYRTVSTLVDVDVVHALAVDENGKTFGLAHAPHHHAVCSRCGATIGVPAEQVTIALMGPSSDFALSQQSGMILRGLCPDCRAHQPTR